MQIISPKLHVWCFWSLSSSTVRANLCESIPPTALLRNTQGRNDVVRRERTDLDQPPHAAIVGCSDCQCHDWNWRIRMLKKIQLHPSSAPPEVFELFDNNILHMHAAKFVVYIVYIMYIYIDNHTVVAEMTAFRRCCPYREVQLPWHCPFGHTLAPRFCLRPRCALETIFDSLPGITGRHGWSAVKCLGIRG